jgi:hypothetical protein
MQTNPKVKSWRGWVLGLLVLGGVLSLGACGKDDDQDLGPLLQPGAQGQVEFTTSLAKFRLRLDVKAGQTYRFFCRPAVLTGCQLQLRDAETLKRLGDSRATDRKWNVGVTLFWKAAETGPVVMELTPVFTLDPGETGKFTYEFTEDADEVGDSVEEAVAQPVTTKDTVIEGALEFTGDVDVWRFSMPENHILRAVCYATEAGSDPDIEILRPDGTLLGTHNHGVYNPDDFFGFINYLALKNVGGGDFILRVQANHLRPAISSPPYTCTVRDTGPDDHGDDAAHATLVTVPARVEVTFGFKNDVDVLATDLIAGHVYLLKDPTYPAGPDTKDAIPYCATTVTDAQGTQQGPTLVTYGEGARFTAPTSGRYFLALENAYSAGSIWVPVTYHKYEITDVTP